MASISSIKDVPKEDFVGGGTFACPGCGAIEGVKYTLKALGKNTIMVNTSGCMTLTALYPFTPYKVPWVHNAIENGASTATGILMGLRALKKEKNVNIVVYAGDGATYDIGFQSLSGAADRKEDIIYVCYNNSFYSNTGFQTTAATPLFSGSTSEPVAKFLPRKHMAKLMVDHDCYYVATASVAYPIDYMQKLQKATKFPGLKFIDLQCPCVPGWNYHSGKTVRVGKAMVESGLWPVYEVVDKRLKVTITPKMIPVKEALKMQGRFKDITPLQIEEVQRLVDLEWEYLEKGKYFEAHEF